MSHRSAFQWIPGFINSAVYADLVTYWITGRPGVLFRVTLRCIPSGLTPCRSLTGAIAWDIEGGVSFLNTLSIAPSLWGRESLAPFFILSRHPPTFSALRLLQAGRFPLSGHNKKRCPAYFARLSGVFNPRGMGCFFKYLTSEVTHYVQLYSIKPISHIR